MSHRRMPQGGQFDRYYGLPLEPGTPIHGLQGSMDQLKHLGLGMPEDPRGGVLQRIQEQPETGMALGELGVAAMARASMLPPRGSGGPEAAAA